MQQRLLNLTEIEQDCKWSLQFKFQAKKNCKTINGWCAFCTIKILQQMSGHPYVHFCWSQLVIQLFSTGSHIIFTGFKHPFSSSFLHRCMHPHPNTSTPPPPPPHTHTHMRIHSYTHIFYPLAQFLKYTSIFKHMSREIIIHEQYIIVLSLICKHPQI